ncbi:hypothetical protein L9G74_00330 [Shewanella sp. C32]|uniref:DUF3108 domain-containing protein n=1 Tax=Shewanella electrica TaxID=515560 RepID=A0ABT2FGZ5_9GAMM|nr:hypothetical protein [Shewanella electrica]MCH1925056.1 hypothetical protein [Shewanella electrica]MCS4554880.1 hypothetical protein [Shewanella electrica]
MKPKHIALASLSLLLAACGGADQPAKIPQNSAAVCYNADLYQAGNRYTLRSVTDEKLAFNFTMPGSTDFEGKAVSQLHQTITGTEMDDDMPANTFYYQFDSANYQIRQPAMLMALGGKESVVYSKPAQEQQFNLQPGQSHEQTFTMSEANPDAKETTVKFKRSFVGMEQQSVTAGKFDSCHFKIEVDTTEADGSTDKYVGHQWIAKGLGVIVKQQRGDQVMQLVDAKIGDQHFPAK